MPPTSGEPIEEDGDLFGVTVILASPIAAKAEGGEILVADTVRGLCSGKASSSPIAASSSRRATAAIVRLGWAGVNRAAEEAVKSVRLCWIL